MNAPRAAPDASSVNLFWTGGWDSTFRLLQLLLLHRLPVTPYYLKDPTRPSTPVELATMQRIGQRLGETYPHTRALLQPLRVADADRIAVAPRIAAALREIRGRSYIGDQYAWLPAFCERHGIAGMELSVHVDDKVQALLRPYATEFVHAGGYRSTRVDPRHAGTAEFALFGGFGLPLFHIDKLGISRLAAAEGWDTLMDMTWFCHRPVRGRPCGLCAPCIYTIEEGLAHRVPATRRALSRVYRRLLLPWKAPLRRMRAAITQRRNAGEPAPGEF